METFYLWLQHQTEREDEVGDFACTVRQFEEPIPNRKKMSGHMMWATWLIDKRATADVIEAFNQAWREYQNIAAFVA